MTLIVFRVFDLEKSNDAREFYGNLWLRSAKLARKSGFYQTAYIAILNAEKYESPDLLVERAKLLRAQGQIHRAIEILQSFVLFNGHILDSTLSIGTSLNVTASSNAVGMHAATSAKAALLMGRWMEESGIGRPAQIEAIYKRATSEMPRWEKAWFFFGHHFNVQFDEQTERYGKLLAESETIDKRFFEKEKLDW